MPAPMVAVMAGRPSTVAGILMSALGRSTVAQSSAAWLIVPSVSCARRGSTSIDTRPSSPSLAPQTGMRTSHAARTSSVVSTRMIASTSAPESASSLSWPA